MTKKTIQLDFNAYSWEKVLKSAEDIPVYHNKIVDVNLKHGLFLINNFHNHLATIKYDFVMYADVLKEEYQRQLAKK